MGEVEQLVDLFTGPGSVTERVVFFTATYSAADRVSGGGGVEVEGEAIDVLELTIDEALTHVETGAIQDDKTVILLQWASTERLRPAS